MTCLDARQVFANYQILPRGYVTIGRKAGKPLYAHRHVYEEAFGFLGEALEVHHACGNPACVNPAHLRALERTAHRREHRVTHCKKGHELTPDYTLFDPWRRCRRCRDERQREHRRTPEYREKRNRLRREQYRLAKALT